MRDLVPDLALSEVSTGAPPPAPALVFACARGVAWAAGPERIARERAGHDAARGHPLLPRLLAASERALLIEPVDVERALPDIAGALLAARPSREEVQRQSVRAHLAALSLPVHVGRALARAGLSRRRIDRLLAREVETRTLVGPTLGGLDPRGLRLRPDGRASALVFAEGRSEGPFAQALAAAHVGSGLDLREVHAELLEGDARAHAAYAIALVGEALRALVLGGDQDAGVLALEAIAILDPEPKEEERALVRVVISAPPFFPVERYTRGRGELPPAEARWVARTLDGLCVGGAELRVTLDPPLRPGRASSPREPERARRGRLFSRWDQGIRVDDEGLYSATPEALADRIAEGARGVVIDGTCGVGSIALALARRPEVTRVLAVDVDAGRLAMARHNAGVYGVADRIMFVQGDVAHVLARERADHLVLDPPWGGRDYDRSRSTFADLGIDLRPLLARFSGPVTLKLPRSFDVAELGEGWRIEPAIDERGIVKMLVARRFNWAETTSAP